MPLRWRSAWKIASTKKPLRQPKPKRVKPKTNIRYLPRKYDGIGPGRVVCINELLVSALRCFGYEEQVSDIELRVMGKKREVQADCMMVELASVFGKNVICKFAAAYASYHYDNISVMDMINTDSSIDESVLKLAQQEGVLDGLKLIGSSFGIIERVNDVIEDAMHGIDVFDHDQYILILG